LENIVGLGQGLLSCSRRYLRERVSAE